MNTLFVLCVVLGVLPLLFGRIGRRLGRRAESMDGRAVFSLIESLDRELNYLPLQRLFSSRDMEYLREQAGFHRGLERRFLQERRHTGLIYLRQMHRDFDLFSGFCRELSSRSRNPGLAVVVAKRTVLFHFRYAILMVNCRFGSLAGVRATLPRLVDAIGDLRREGEHRWALTTQPSESWASSTTAPGSAIGG